MYTVLPNKDDEKYIDLVSPSGEILTSNWKGTAGSGTKELSKMADILNAEIAPLRQRIAELENAVEKALAALPDADAAAAYLREVVNHERRY